MLVNSRSAGLKVDSDPALQQAAATGGRRQQRHSEQDGDAAASRGHLDRPGT